MAGLFGLTFSAFLFLHATQPVSDTDFWWHLKTGESMFQQKGLLDSDPFTFRTEGDPTPRENLILKGYWLWEVTAYGLYKTFGLNGILLLNLLFIGTLAVVIIHRLGRSGVTPALATPLLLVSFILFRGYNLERPQVVSFLCATLLMGMFLEVRNGGKFGWPLPLLMCLWANLHGGFVVGDIMLGCFAVGVLFEYRHDLNRRNHLLGWTLAGICASLLNPAGWLAIVESINFLGKPLQTGVVEYRSTWVEFNEGTKFTAIVWLLIFIYGLGVSLSKRRYLPELLVALFLAFFSMRYVRNVAFFSVAMLPAVGLAWQDVFQKKRWTISPTITCTIIGLATLPLLWLTVGEWKYRDFSLKVAPIYPEAAINFLQQSGMQGRMFNSYEYGGYLLWRLAPRMRVFIDGRGIDEQVFDDYEKIRLASLRRIDGQAEYKALLEQYQIGYVIQPIYDGYGNVQPLMKALLKNDDWLPIYLDQYVYILARDAQQNRDVIASYVINKNDFSERLLLIYDYLQRAYPRQIGFKVARAGMLTFLGRYQEAKSEIETIARLAPNEKMLPLLRDELRLLTSHLDRK